MRGRLPTARRSARADNGSFGDDNHVLESDAADAVLSPERVAQHPDKPAILFNDQAVSYAQLLARVNRFGNALARADVRRETRVMLLLKDSPDMVAAYLGA